MLSEKNLTDKTDIWKYLRLSWSNMGSVFWLKMGEEENKAHEFQFSYSTFCLNILSDIQTRSFLIKL